MADYYLPYTASKVEQILKKVDENGNILATTDANNTVYDNAISGLSSINAQDAIDELTNKEKTLEILNDTKTNKPTLITTITCPKHSAYGGNKTTSVNIVPYLETSNFTNFIIKFSGTISLTCSTSAGDFAFGIFKDIATSTLPNDYSIDIPTTPLSSIVPYTLEGYGYIKKGQSSYDSNGNFLGYQYSIGTGANLASTNIVGIGCYRLYVNSQYVSSGDITAEIYGIDAKL